MDRDPDAQKIERFGPTPATLSMMILLWILMCFHWELSISDARTAFTQSDKTVRPQGRLFANFPLGGIMAW